LPANRPRAISESDLSDSKGLQRHFRVAGLATPDARTRRPPSISRHFVLNLDEAEKPAKAKGFISPSETNGFATCS
jgi:hypothetical protein